MINLKEFDTNAAVAAVQAAAQAAHAQIDEAVSVSQENIALSQSAISSLKEETLESLINQSAFVASDDLALGQGVCGGGDYNGEDNYVEIGVNVICNGQRVKNQTVPSRVPFGNYRLVLILVPKS